MLYRRTIIFPGDAHYDDVAATPSTRPGRSVRLHAILFLATVITTTAVGAIMQNHNPFTSFRGFAAGLPFSMTLLCILGVHEFGHYFLARRWYIDVTLPYFIPAPFLPIGTFGAVISMKSSIPSRKALVDVGVSGPVAGFLVALAASYIGLRMSTVQAVSPEKTGEMFMLGESLVFKSMSWLVFGSLPENTDVFLHPVAFAGWIGLFVTALNLIPLGQLDGGHILFALSPRVHELFRRIRIPVLLLMGMAFWDGWYVWAVLSLFFGRHHPYPSVMESSIGPVRTTLAVVAMVIFVLCITPTPIKMGS
jgi:membrane-associated protease RseP (regulator of RpoE activity)